MTASLMAVNDGWLEHCGQSIGATVGGLTAVGGYWPNNGFGYYYYPVYQVSPARPIKLTMSEVERLRKAAKEDADLKAILVKFTSQIEITVDFD